MFIVSLVIVALYVVIFAGIKLTVKRKPKTCPNCVKGVHTVVINATDKKPIAAYTEVCLTCNGTGVQL